MPGTGIQNVPLRFPREAPPWFVEWFSGFVRDVLVPLDVRNSIEGLGISVTGTPDVPATISASEDLSDLFDADILLAEATALLPNARTLEGEEGITLTDEGPGGNVNIRIEDNALQLAKLQKISPLSVLGNDTNAAADVRRIASHDDDTAFVRIAGELLWAQLTAAMAPDGLWPYAKLDAGVRASLDLADSAVQPGDSPSFTLADYVDDTAAAAGGVAVGQLYRNGSVVMVRVA